MNQINLYNLIVASTNKQPNSRSIETDTSHGRSVTRVVEVFEADAILDKKWHGVKSFVKVERSGIRKEKGKERDYNQTHYYLSSLLIDADLIAPKIRGHWSIAKRCLEQVENQLH